MRKLAVQELDRLSPEDYKRAEKRPVRVVLDNIRSAHNVGSVFRTCDAFLIEHICICGFSAKPPHKDILKTALGATDTVAWSYTDSTAEAVKALKADGFMIIAVEQAEGSIALESMDWQSMDKVALVFGNEVRGVDDAVMELADLALEVPQWGTKHSLNISVCAGIVLWDIVRSGLGPIKIPC